MIRPKIGIFDFETGEEIIREMNDEEFVQYKLDKSEHELVLKNSEKKTSAKSALLAKLGITEDEAKLLLG